jgi:enoyl-CoA hydratase/carnithine racemase/membrane protein YdbS with pleckstrin-like domain
MLLPVLAFVIIAAAVGVGAALIPREARPIGQLAIALLGVVLLIWLVLIPFLRWRTTTYTITNRRLITRSGILNKVGKDLPLNRINEVSYERSLIDRMLGCGSLIVQTAAEDGTIVLHDVPDVEHVNLEMTVEVGRPAAHVAEVIMNRPEALNALSTEHVQRLGSAASELAADDQVSVVIISSALDRAFCVGADLKERRGVANDDLRQQRRVFQEAFDALRALRTPTIAAVEGFALGGGFELALCCDLIIASATASFGLPEVGLGLIPGEGGTQLLPRRIGLNKSADLLLTGRRVGAEEALRMGFVDRLVPEGAARSSARELAQEIATKSPISLRAAKRALRDGIDVDLSSGLEIENQAWEEAAFSADRLEGIEAFNMRRAPRWPSWQESGR